MNEIIFLLKASGITIYLAICSLVAGLMMTVIFALWESVRCRYIAWIGSSLTIILRGLPEVLTILIIYFGLSRISLFLSDGFIINLGVMQFTIRIEIKHFNISPFLCGVITLSLLYAAYASQILRGALKAVPIGQWESGKALALTKYTILLLIIVPQMWRYSLPGLSNQWLILLKDTALVSLISVNDLMLQTKIIANRTQDPFTWYIMAAIIYLIITLLSQYILRYIGRCVTYFNRRSS